MTPSEFIGWEIHFRRFPPTEYLLALICHALLTPIDDDESLDTRLFGQWIETTEEREERLKEEEKAKLAEDTAMTERLYDEMKAQRDNG